MFFWKLSKKFFYGRLSINYLFFRGASQDLLPPFLWQNSDRNQQFKPWHPVVQDIGWETPRRQLFSDILKNRCLGWLAKSKNGQSEHRSNDDAKWITVAFFYVGRQNGTRRSMPSRQPNLPLAHPCWDIGKLSWRQGCSADEVSLCAVQSDRGATTAAWTGEDAPIPVAQCWERTSEKTQDHQQEIGNPGGCRQWAAMVRQCTASGGRGCRGCQVGGLHHVGCSLSCISLPLPQ